MTDKGRLKRLLKKFKKEDQQYKKKKPKDKRKIKKPKKLTPIQKAGKKFSKELAHRATPSERRFKVKLMQFKFGFSFQKPFSDKYTLYIADFFLPNFNLDIELDGGYHFNPEQKEKDDKRDNWFKSKGMNVWRLTNKEADDISPQEILQHLSQYKRNYNV